MSVTCMQVPVQAKKDIRSPGARVRGGCKQSDCGHRDPNSSSLKEQQVLLTAQPSL